MIGRMKEMKGIACGLAVAALFSGCGVLGEDAATGTAAAGWQVQDGSFGQWERASGGSASELPLDFMEASQGISLERVGEPSQGDALDSPEASQGVLSERFGEPSQGDALDSAQPPRPEITLVMVGDVLLHARVAESGKGEDGSYDFTAVFAQVREEIQAADLALVNQEVIIGGEELGVSGYPAFNAPYELGDALADAGFNVALHATNHALDKGKRGIRNCLAFWQENHPDMAVLGIHGSEADQEEIYIYEQDGIRIAILNYTYGTNGIALPGDMPYAVDMLEKNRVEADLQKAGEMADFVVVCPHWGTEYALSATKVQREWAEFFAEGGADLVLGTHPHVIEPIEWVGADEKTLVYYSLGNFVNWTSGTGEGVANRMVGGMAYVTIGLDKAGEAVIETYGVEPLVCHVEQGYGGVTVYPLEKYTERLAARNEIIKQDASFTLEYCHKLAEEVFGTQHIIDSREQTLLAE